MHTREPLPKPSELRPGISAEFERVIVKTLAKNPNDRHQTAGDSRELQRLIQQPEPSKPVAPPVSSVPLHRYSRRSLRLPRFTSHSHRNRVRLAAIGWSFTATTSPRTVTLDKPTYIIDEMRIETSRFREPKSRARAKLERGADGNSALPISARPTARGSMRHRWLPMPHVMEPGHTVRISDFYLRIEPAATASADITHRGAGGAAPGRAPAVSPPTRQHHLHMCRHNHSNRSMHTACAAGLYTAPATLCTACAAATAAVCTAFRAAAAYDSAVPQYPSAPQRTQRSATHPVRRERPVRVSRWIVPTRSKSG
jgi:hypothetical protein